MSKEALDAIVRALVTGRPVNDANLRLEYDAEVQAILDGPQFYNYAQAAGLQPK